MKEGTTPELAELILAGVDRRLGGVHVSMPGRVISYNAAEQSAQIQPTVSPLILTTEGDEPVDLPIIPSAPVLFPRAGGFRMTFPIKPDDTGLLIIASHAIETWLRQNSPRDVEALDPRRFHLSDAVFLPGLSPFAALTPADVDDLVIEKVGGVAIHLGDLINLGSKAAADFPALAGLTTTELTVMKSAIAGAVVVAGDGGASLKATILAALASFPGPIAATKVKVD